MITNKKPTGRAASMPKGLFLGAMVSLLITILSAIVIAKLVNSEYLQEAKIGYGIMLSIMVSSFSGSMLATFQVKRRILLVCMLSGILYFLILLSITAIFFGGQYEAVGVTGILVMGSAVLAAFTVLPDRKRRTKRRGGK